MNWQETVGDLRQAALGSVARLALSLRNAARRSVPRIARIRRREFREQMKPRFRALVSESIEYAKKSRFLCWLPGIAGLRRREEAEKKRRRREVDLRVERYRTAIQRLDAKVRELHGRGLYVQLRDLGQDRQEIYLVSMRRQKLPYVVQAMKITTGAGEASRS